MPRCGSHVISCDLPIRIDSYVGCGFGCTYCNEQAKGRQRGIPVPGEGVKALRNFIQGKRVNVTNWCDWDIPLHWGVLSDPFQQCEMAEGHSEKLLREFARTGYPVVISTKSDLLVTPGYYGLLRASNAVLQVSMTSQWYDEQEGCPSFSERFGMLYNLSKAVRRLLVRVQPYRLADYDFVVGMLRAYAASGVWGIMVEGMKVPRVTDEFPERYGSSGVYDAGELGEHFSGLRAACHDHGLRFYSAENRLRMMGDSMTCCGVEGLESFGFIPNVANLNYTDVKYTDRMAKSGTGGVFVRSWWDAKKSRKATRLSYRELMEDMRTGA